MSRRRVAAFCVSVAATGIFGAACRSGDSAPGPRHEADVVVYGGTSAGVMAAVQASRMGMEVLLVVPRGPLGGLSASGLGQTDTGDEEAIGGLAREFYAAVHDWYGRDEAWTRGKSEDFSWRDPDSDAQWRFEPRVAEAIFEAFLAGTEAVVLRGERLDRENGLVRSTDGRIASLRTESGRVVCATMYIDASYEGDLMAAAGVPFTVGRESNDRYGETLNGVQTRRAVHHQFEYDVDPWIDAGDPTSGLVPGVASDGPGVEGASDARVQAYNYRLCLTDDPENRVPFSRPDGYREADYELLLRHFEAGATGVPWYHGEMPNRKTDTNNNGAFSTDGIGLFDDYPEASYEERERIAAEQERYQRGLLWTLVSNPRVPADVRAEVGRWGFARDEFEATGNWPPLIYVREARRMVGDYVVTEADCTGQRRAPDPVGMAAYTMDSHNVQRYVDDAGLVRNEGDVQVRPAGPYPISYRAILTPAGSCDNLLVPVCVSASHIAFGSIRMEPVFMILGQAAATAACLAIEAGGIPRTVEYELLRERLLADGQVLQAR